MRLTRLSNLSVMLAQVVFLVSIFVVDLTQSTDSAAAFSSAKKTTSSENSLSSNRHKRRVTDDALFRNSNGARFFDDGLDAEKRAPGWGKRSGDDFDEEEDQVAKEAAKRGWGKRAPGWGKRSGEDFDEDEVQKRAPGWGKRAPGWGKRGWGKRGWGKRAPGWGKRTVEGDMCDKLDDLVESLVLKANKASAIRSEHCGSNEEGNRPFRK